MFTAPTASPGSPLGMTLADFAAAHGKHRQAIRPLYQRMLRLGEGAETATVTRVDRHEGVTKFCLGVDDAAAGGLETESVIIPMRNYHGAAWYTLCVSTQLGCRMGCTFCETGDMGLVRQLTAAEIVQQRLAARRLLLGAVGATPPGRYRYFADGIRNVVFMGMGEPLDNFDALLQAIRVMHEPAGLDIPYSQMTVSTVGRIDGIRRLAQSDLPQIRLAISLNAANDSLRNSLMPINKGMPLADLQRTLLEYPLPPRGRFIVGYVLLKGINDSLRDADAVAAWCAPLRCTVNLIPYNEQRNALYETPPEETVQAFLQRLRSRGIFVKRRVTQGRDIMGACG